MWPLALSTVATFFVAVTCYVLSGRRVCKPALLTKPLDMQASIIRHLSQARINWDGCGRKGIRLKNGEMMEMGAPIVQMGGVQTGCRCICLCFLSLHHKIQKMASNNGGS